MLKQTQQSLFYTEEAELKGQFDGVCYNNCQFMLNKFHKIT